MKTKFLQTLCAIAVVSAGLSLTSCDSSPLNTPDAIPVKLDGEDAWSLMSLDGEFYAKNKLEGMPSFAYNGRFVVYDEDGMYAYDISDPGKALNKEAFQQLTHYACGNAFGVRQGTGILVVDRNGEVIKELDQDIAQVCVGSLGDVSRPRYRDGDGKWGYLDANGNIDLKAKWDNVGVFSEGRAIAAKDNRLICIDTKGEKVFTLKENEELGWSCFVNGWLAVNKDSRGHFVDHSGETVMKMPRDTRAVIRVGNRVIGRNDDGWMMLEAKEDGEKILKGYDAIVPMGFDGTRFVVRKKSGSKYRIVDADGEDIGETSFERIDEDFVLWGISIIGKKDDVYKLYTPTGELIDKKIEISDTGFEAFDNVVSQKIYSKKQVSGLVDLIGNSDRFGGTNGVPAIAPGAKASDILPALNVDAKDEYRYYNSGTYRISTQLPDDLGTLYTTFVRNPVDYASVGDFWSYQLNYYFTDAPVSLLVIDTPIDTEARLATVAALCNALTDKGWTRSEGRPYELTNNAGNRLYIVPADDSIRIVYAFGPLDYNKVMGSALSGKTKSSGTYDYDNYYNYVDSDSVATPAADEEYVYVP